MIFSLSLVLAGLILLTKSADQFVTGSARMASIMRISPFIVGALVMGFGTSAPEMLVSGIAASKGNLDFGVGNLVGSNITNLTIVLGVAGMILAVPVRKRVLRVEAPMTLAAALIFGWILQNGVERWEGFLLLGFLVAALSVILIRGRGTGTPEELEEILGEEESTKGREMVRILIGLVGTVAGAAILVKGGEGVAEELGLSAGFIGLTLIAVGTSLPELVTSVVAARRGHTELIIGNLLGSNLLNSLGGGAVLGLVSTTSELDDGRLAGLPVLIMISASVLAIGAMISRKRVSRSEGVILIAVWLLSMPFMPY